MSNECINIFMIQIEYIAERNITLKQLTNCQSLSRLRLWCKEVVVY